MKYLVSAALGIFGMLALPVSASAAVVCNADGDCWRTAERHAYPPDVNLQIYDDDWTWGDRPNYRWRDAGPGRGYYRGGVWIGF
jgi:hypothetical protein